MKRSFLIILIMMLILPLSLSAQKKKFTPEKSDDKEKVEPAEPEKKEEPAEKKEDKDKKDDKEDKEKKKEPEPVKKTEPVKKAEPLKPAEPVKPAEALPAPKEPELVPVKIEPPAPAVEEKKEPAPEVKPALTEKPALPAEKIEPPAPAVKKPSSPEYSGESNTSKLPFAFAGMPSTAYGTGLLSGGNASNENGYFFEGVKIPFTHHLMTEKSIISRNLLKDTYSMTGAFGPELGDSTGGVINLAMRNPREDRIGGTFDISMLGASLMAEGPISKSDSFSASFDYGADDLFTRMAYDNVNSVATQNNISGHVRYIHKIDAVNSIRLNIIGARDSQFFLSSYKKNGVPNLNESLSPESMFILAKGDYDYNTCTVDSRFSGSFTLSNWDYAVYKGGNFSTIDNRGTIEEHLSWKINDSNRLDFGVVFMAGIFSTDTVNSLLPLEGEPGLVRTDSRLVSKDNIGYIQPSLYIKYRLALKGFEAVPGIHLSGDFHNKEEWSGSVDPRLLLSYSIKDIVKIYAVGGMYSKRPQYDISLYQLGNESVNYERSVHGRLGAALEYKGISADVSGFYKYFYDLIRRNPEKANDYENTGSGWAAGAEIKLGYKNRELDGWVSYTFVKSVRKDSKDSDERRSDADIPHIFKAAFAYNFLKNWNLSADIAVTSGMLVTDYSGTKMLADSGIYIPIYLQDDINGIRLSGTVGYGLKLEYMFFLKALKIGVYGDIRGSSTTVDRVYNADYTDHGNLYYAPVIGTAGIRGDF